MRLAYRTASALAVMVAAATLGGCSSGGSATPAKSASPAPSTTVTGATITIRNFTFSPAALTVHPGQRVTVENQDVTTHTVTASPAGPFDTGDIPADATKEFTAPTTPGTYNYICSIHQFMHGILTVS